MFRTLYAKLALVLVVLFASVGLLYALISTSITRHYLVELNQHFNWNLARNLVADRNLVAEGRLDQQALQETFHQYMVINPSIEIYLLDTEGRILSYSADPGKVKRKRVAMEPVQTFLQGQGRYPLLGDDPRSHDRRKAFSATAVPSAEDPQGYLYVVLRGEEFEAADQLVRESYFLRLSAWSVAASLGFGLLAGLLLFHLLTRRLHRLSTLMDGFQESDFTSRSAYAKDKTRRGDEVDRLGYTFDRMAERIREQLDQLKRQDSLRRQLVARVSHDLRTPLAALQGYMESLSLKRRELSNREQSEYVDLALRQSRRLSRQLDELFELASLDARETQPQCEAFTLAELLQDVLQKYQLRAEQAQVRLQLSPPGRLPFVHGDIGLTERVLENLLENAFTHTPHGGAITLDTLHQGDRIKISVKDTGPGISEEDQAHLFEPFYQSESGSRSRRHVGLGLAIARRIIELQQGEIGVQSRLGQGAVFYFTLPVSAP